MSVCRKLEYWTKASRYLHFFLLRSLFAKLGIIYTVHKAGLWWYLIHYQWPYIWHQEFLKYKPKCLFIWLPQLLFTSPVFSLGCYRNFQVRSLKLSKLCMNSHKHLSNLFPKLIFLFLKKIVSPVLAMLRQRSFRGIVCLGQIIRMYH